MLIKIVVLFSEFLFLQSWGASLCHFLSLLFLALDFFLLLPSNYRLSITLFPTLLLNCDLHSPWTFSCLSILKHQITRDVIMLFFFFNTVIKIICCLIQIKCIFKAGKKNNQLLHSWQFSSFWIKLKPGLWL